MSGRHNNRRNGKGKKCRGQKPSVLQRMEQSARDKKHASSIGDEPKRVKVDQKCDEGKSEWKGLIKRIFNRKSKGASE